MTVGQVLHASVPRHLVYQLARTNDGRASSLRWFCVIYVLLFVWVGGVFVGVFSAFNPSFPMTEGRLPQFRSSVPLFFLRAVMALRSLACIICIMCISLGIFSRFAEELL